MHRVGTSPTNFVKAIGEVMKLSLTPAGISGTLCKWEATTLLITGIKANIRDGERNYLINSYIISNK